MNAYLNLEDPIMDEVYAVRRKISERYGHDINRIAEAMRQRKVRDEANGIRYVRLPIARVAPAGN